jgi:hypothetical protein
MFYKRFSLDKRNILSHFVTPMSMSKANDFVCLVWFYNVPILSALEQERLILMSFLNIEGNGFDPCSVLPGN